MRRGESASIEDGAGGWGGVNGSVARGREDVRSLINFSLSVDGAGAAALMECSTMSTDLFWCGYRFIAWASEISSAVPCVSCDDCEKGVTCAERRWPKSGSPFVSTVNELLCTAASLGTKTGRIGFCAASLAASSA